MSARAFKISLALLAVLVLLSALLFPGAVIGFGFGIAVAFFIAPLAFLLEAAGHAAGIPVTFDQILECLAAFYGLAVLRATWTTYRARVAGDAAAVRRLAMRAVLLAALPLIAWLSSEALARAWP